ncbi:MAG: hypothetical protein AB7E51_15150 [Pseudodesulfovibrio sp.]|uniref:hypothetical protein n=1 Tax=Pseudodesulfovibrio sp. TaxID=2035812 RepID=UPI003D0BD624
MRVPKYQRQQVEQFQPFRPGDLSQAFGVGNWAAAERTGERLQQAGSEVFEIAAQEKKRDDIRRTKDVYLNQTKQLQQLMHGENGFLTRMGNNAEGSYDEVNKQLEEIREQAMGDLANERQQQLFADMWDRDATQASGQVLTHQTKQLKLGEIETTKSLLDEHVNEYIAATGDDEAQFHARAKIESDVRSQASLAGWSTEETKAYLGEQEAKAHIGVINTYLARNNPEEAQKYYDEAKEGIPGSMRPKVEAALRQANSDAKVDSAYAQLYRDFPGKNGMDYGRALTSLADPNTRKRLGLSFKEAETLTNALEGQRATALSIVDKQREDARNSGFKQILQMHENGDTMGALRVLRSLPGVHPATAINLEKALRTPVQSWVTNPATYRNLIEDVRSGVITRQSEIISQVGDSLTPQDAEKAVRFLDLIQKPEGEMIKKAVKALDEAINGGLMAQKTPATTRAFQAAYMELMDAVDKARGDGRDLRDILTPGSKDYLLDKLIMGHQVSIQEQMQDMTSSMTRGSSRDDTGKAGSIPADPRKVEAPEGMPPDQVQKALDQLAAGKTVRVEKDGVVRELVYKDGRLEFK